MNFPCQQLQIFLEMLSDDAGDDENDDDNDDDENDDDDDDDDGDDGDYDDDDDDGIDGSVGAMDCPGNRVRGEVCHMQRDLFAVPNNTYS